MTGSSAATSLRTQSAPAVLMVRPAHFAFNEETAASNRFQQPGADTGAAAAARAEFDALAASLRQAGVNLCVAEDSPAPAKPDAVFPNNWVSFHRDGTVVLYPMQAPNRRLERRDEIVQLALRSLGFALHRLLDLSSYEQQGRFLEGTGSLVLDHIERVAYGCVSPRTDEGLMQQWGRELGFAVEALRASGRDGAPLYHTNVLMSIGTRWAALCPEAIDAADRNRVMQRLRASGREIIEFDMEALYGFAGNVLELASADRAVLVLSQAAAQSLRRAGAWARLQSCVDECVIAAIPTIERLGGGSVRCMLAEVPERA